MDGAKLTAYLAELSKLAFTNDELEKITADMTDIIRLMDKVREFDLENGTYALDAVEYKSLRRDEVKESFETEKIIKNAQQVKNNSFAAPKVV